MKHKMFEETDVLKLNARRFFSAGGGRVVGEEIKVRFSSSLAGNLSSSKGQMNHLCGPA